MGFFDFFSTSQNTFRMQLEEKESQLQVLQKHLCDKDALLHELESQLQQSQNYLDNTDALLHETESRLQQSENCLDNKAALLHELESQLQQSQDCLRNKNTLLHEAENQLLLLRKQIRNKNTLLYEMERQMQLSQNHLDDKDALLHERNMEIASLHQRIAELADKLQEQESEFLRLRSTCEPYLQSTECLQTLLEQIEEQKKSILYTNFFYILNCYRLEKVLHLKRKECRMQYNSALASCKQKIQEYEEAYHLEEYKQLKPYIKADEFYSLPTHKRNQLALSRYIAAPKSDYEIGLNYERYIGYLYELEGFEVRYHGALNKLKDKGIDLYAIKKKEVIVIQCKRWSKDSQVNDGTIRNLYGSVGLAQKKFPARQIKGVLYTTTAVSKEAKSAAADLNLEIYDNFPIKKYPLIKCNISETGEKIYHLPFDQMYDKTFITLAKGDFYAATVQEAEALGFRHAHKWKPNK